MKPLKQCCMCLRVLVARSARTGREVWHPTPRPMPVSHGLCPACAQVYRARALKAG